MERRDLEAAFTGELVAVNRRLRALFDERARNMGLTLARARLLVELARHDGPIQSDLAEILEIEQPTLVRLLDGLERSGMIERRAVEGDRRARRVFLTELARAQAQDVLALLGEIRALVLKDSPDQALEAALGVLRQASRNIAAGRGGAT
ncbi:MarR family winged helix-turn-helix transcriptional regulator [Bosea sp. (in: a-proteobacteria)]|uniref:MarR family winged helix-turn-helix transcriptional regulator n=1 Tax=Bosea sp. (in: a-proteobacteria) TaxID=1871050 RepID=UPI003B3B52C3